MLIHCEGTADVPLHLALTGKPNDHHALHGKTSMTTLMLESFLYHYGVSNSGTLVTTHFLWLHNIEINNQPKTSISVYLPQIFFQITSMASVKQDLQGIFPILLILDYPFLGESFVVALDISKAFDRAWHKALLAKLPAYVFIPHF